MAAAANLVRTETPAADPSPVVALKPEPPKSESKPEAKPEAAKPAATAQGAAFKKPGEKAEDSDNYDSDFDF